MDAGELGTMLSNVDSGLFRFHEVIFGAGQPISAGDYTSIGHVTEFDFFRKLDANVKDEGKLQYLDGFGESWGLISGGKAVTFIDNHDTQRGEAPLTYRDGRVYELASIFMLAHPYGYPKIMSSYFFDAGNKDQGPPSTPVHANNGVNCVHGQPWVCEHRWSTIGNMVNWRKSAGTSGVSNFQKFSGNTIAFCRGTAACVAMNRGGDTWNANVKFSVPAGTYCNVIEDDEPSTCPKITVNSDGSASFQVEYQRAVAVHIGKKAADSIIV
jgi:alpha-amylase